MFVPLLLSPALYTQTSQGHFHSKYKPLRWPCLTGNYAKGFLALQEEKSKKSETSAPPLSSLSLPCALSWGNAAMGLRRTSLIPAPHDLLCNQCASAASLTPLVFHLENEDVGLEESGILIWIPSCPCLWVWHTTDISTKREVAVLDTCYMGLPSTILPPQG